MMQMARKKKKDIPGRERNGRMRVLLQIALAGDDNDQLVGVQNARADIMRRTAFRCPAQEDIGYLPGEEKDDSFGSV